MLEAINTIRTSLSENGAPSSDYDLNPEIVLPAGRELRPASVLIPLIQKTDGWHIILTIRSSALKHHPGQIAFPGGKRDEGDQSLIETALREADEEIGLSKNEVKVLGQLPSHETVTGFTVTPVVGVVSSSFKATPEPGEVAEVFTVPFDFLMQPKNFQIQSRRWRGKRRYFYTIPYGPYYIWGASARMLRVFADALGAK